MYTLTLAKSSSDKRIISEFIARYKTKTPAARLVDLLALPQLNDNSIIISLSLCVVRLILFMTV